MIYIIAFILNVCLALWVQHDAKRFRTRGVWITPGLWSTLVFFGSIPIFLLYLLVRISVYAPKSKLAGLQPLPPAARWTNWLTVLILLVVTGGIVLAIVASSYFRKNEFESNAPTNTESVKTFNDIPVAADKSQRYPIPGFKMYADKEVGFSFQYPDSWVLSTKIGTVTLQNSKEVEGPTGNFIMTGKWTIGVGDYNLPQSSIDKVRKDVEQKSNVIISGIKAQKEIVRNTSTLFEAKISFVVNNKMVDIREQWFIGGAIDGFQKYSNKEEILALLNTLTTSIRFEE